MSQATAELIPLLEVLDRPELVTAAADAMRTARLAYQAGDADASLGRCGTCRRPWAWDRLPAALVELRVGGEAWLALACGDCATGPREALGARLELMLRELLPEGAKVTGGRVVIAGDLPPAGHA